MDLCKQCCDYSFAFKLLFFYSVAFQQSVLNVIFLASNYSHQVWDVVSLVLIAGTASFRNILDSWTDILSLENKYCEV